MNYSLSPTTHTIHLTADTIDAGQIIALARELDAGECPGACGDDNQNGWFGLKPKWLFRLTIGGAEYKAIVVKLAEFGGRKDAYSLVLDPMEKREIALPAFDRGHVAGCKHTGSQLLDCMFRVDFRDADEEVWFQAKWLDTSLLRWMLRPRNRDKILQGAEEQCRAFASRHSPEALDAMIKEQANRELAYWIDPAYRVFFVCQGHAFSVDRSGPDLVLVPVGEKS